jgi:hypothetical protein
MGDLLGSNLRNRCFREPCWPVRACAQMSDPSTAIDVNPPYQRRFQELMEEIDDAKGSLTSGQYVRLCNAAKACFDEAKRLHEDFFEQLN